jgi:hypothetical protein
MRPSTKSPEITALLEGLSGRTTALRNESCVDAPMGCGAQDVGEGFRDLLSAKEYTISGLCQDCQDEVFGK